jgi:hypothetical protein
MKSSAQVEKPIESRILVVRGQRVMLDTELAKLYGVEAKVLNQAVRRNADRFPPDFMFQLSWEDLERSRSQFLTMNETRHERRFRGRNVKYRPLAFTEQGGRTEARYPLRGPRPPLTSVVGGRFSGELG